MNKFLSRISVRILMILLVITLLLTAAVYFYWSYTVMPNLLQSEQTKADLLLNQYAGQIEQKLEMGGTEKEVELLLDEMLLLREPTTKQVLVLSISMEGMDDSRIERKNEISRPVEYEITSSTAVFSPLNQMMVGTFNLQYNDAFVKKISGQIGIRLFMLFLFIVGLLIMFVVFIEFMLQPLSRIATSLNRMRAGEQIKLPEVAASVSWEIRYVHQSISRLLSERQLWEHEIVEEHKRAEEAWQEKLNAERANKAKSRFLANMSHELRTPLNAILGYSEIVLEELEEHNIDMGIQRDMRNIQSSGKHLLSLINDVLDISKIEADRMPIYPTKVDIDKMLDSVMADIKPMAMSNNNELSLDAPENCPYIETDDMRLKQILLNLMSNACKFTENGQVVLQVKCEVEAQKIIFRVMDTGIGISESIQDKVFDAFVQEDSSSTRVFEGTGLGLAISKKLSNLLGGDISVSSKMGEGSVFTFWLPYAHRPQTEERNHEGSG